MEVAIVLLIFKMCSATVKLKRRKVNSTESGEIFFKINEYSCIYAFTIISVFSIIFIDHLQSFEQSRTDRWMNRNEDKNKNDEA